MADKLIDVSASNLTQATFLEVYRAMRLAKSELDTAQGKYRATCKRADEVGVDLKALKLMKQLLDLEPEEATQRLANMRRYNAWTGEGVELDMGFAETAPEVDAAATDKHRQDVAYETGFEHGKISGGIEDCPYPEVGSPLHEAWVSGWHAGQATLAPAQSDAPVVKPASARRKLPVPVHAH